MKLRWKIAQAAEIRWWERYLSAKPKAAYQQWKKAYWHKLLQQIEVSLSPNETILDAGCGPAGIFMILNEQKVTALDPLLEEYEVKLPHFCRSEYPNVQFLSQPLEQYEMQEPVDTVFCLNAINHVADLKLCFDKLVACTKPGGRLIVSIDAHNWLFFKHLFSWVPGDILHPHQYDLKEYMAFLLERGCRIERSVRMDRGFLFDYYVLVARREGE